MIIKVLVEDNNEINEHGLSFYIEYGDQTILFDTGQSDLYLKNAQKLSVDLETIDFAVLSHGHYDHGDGLKYLPSTTLLCHPNVFLKRYHKEGAYIGINQSKAEIEENFKIITSKIPYFVTDNICFLGEVKPRKTKYILEDSTSDYILDDSALAFNSKDGIIIITGCSHAGVTNIVEKSKEVFRKDNIFALIGGFHLKEINSELDSIIKI